MQPFKTAKAFAYLRTSSAANIGDDKDSSRRQLQAIEGFARRAGIELTKTIVVETASRFARDLMVQEVGFAILKARGIDLIAAGQSLSRLRRSSCRPTYRYAAGLRRDA
jgi:hypothetical protein